MATTYPTDTPVTYMNLKQLRAIARRNQLAYDAETTKAELIALIEAE